MTLKALWLQFATIILFTLAFLLESALTIVTVGFYIVFMPDRKLLMHKVSKWSIRTQLRYHFRDSNDPQLQELIKSID